MWAMLASDTVVRGVMGGGSLQWAGVAVWCGCGRGVGCRYWWLMFRGVGAVNKAQGKATWAKYLT